MSGDGRIKFKTIFYCRNFIKTKAMLKIDRITSDPNIMSGKACIRGMRITVSVVLNLLATGMNKEQIIDLYP